ncbi:hypothetical protein [Streptomyces virginiae]|uniref:hypothetical protein n=1 Tax=Streptomyces virginiae TaxID=1961 RepID=UPI003795B7F8
MSLSVPGGHRRATPRASGRTACGRRCGSAPRRRSGSAGARSVRSSRRWVPASTSRATGGTRRGALADAGLSQEIAEAAGSTACDGAVRSSHAQAVAESPGSSPPTPAEASSPGCGVHGADLR